jgi:hypothetical protein
MISSVAFLDAPPEFSMAVNPVNPDTIVLKKRKLYPDRATL